MSPDREITSEELKECASIASKEAVKRARANGISYTAQQGRRIIQHQADGTTVVIDVLSKAYVKPTVKIYSINRPCIA